jgi:hypothetical protein
MNELVNMVAQKVGLPQDKAQLATETVLNFLKGKLPPAIASQIDSVVGGGGGGLGDMAGKLGGMLGK